MKHTIQKSPEEIFSLLLHKLPAVSLKEFMEVIAANDKFFLHQFIIRFAESSAIAGNEKYAVLIRSLLQASKVNSNFNVETALNQLTEKAARMIEAKDFLDAFYIASAFINESKCGILKGEKNFFSFHELLQTAFKLLASIMKSEAGYDLKEKIFQLLIDDVPQFSFQFSHAVKEHWLNATLESTNDEEQFEAVIKMLAAVKEIIIERTGESLDEQDEEQLLIAKWNVLEKMNRVKDAHRLVQSNVRFKFFRLKLTKQYLNDNKFTNAKELIKEGKQLEEHSGRLSVSSEWDQLLLEIAEKENDKKVIRNLALQLFFSSDFEFKYYFLLKQQYESAKWKQQIDRVIQFIRKDPSFYNNGIHAAARIYTMEEEWEKLLLLLQKNTNLDFVEEHSHKLSDKYPHELLEVYRKAIRRFAEKYMGTEAYRRITDAIYKMLLIKDGKEVVQPMLAELKVDYRGRKAFVDALRKIVL